MRNIRRQLGWLIVSIALACAAAAHGRARRLPDAVGSMLYLNDDDYFSGSLRDCPTPNTVRWQARGATQPFEFSADAIRSAYFAPPSNRPAPEGEYRIELSDGDVLFGSLAAVTKDDFEIDSAQFGHLKIARAEIQRLAPVLSAAFAYRGPNGLAEWTSDDISQWREEAGRLVTNKRGASIKKSITIPEQARIEFEIAWDKSAAVFAGVLRQRQNEATRRRLTDWKSGAGSSFSCEKLGKSADVAMRRRTRPEHRPRPPGSHSTTTPRASSWYSRSMAASLAKSRCRKRAGIRCALFRLTNSGGKFRSNSLSSASGTAVLPQKSMSTKPRIHKTDDTIVYGDVTGYDADAKQFLVNVRRERKSHREAQRSRASCSCRATNRRKSAISHRSPRRQPLQRRSGQG